MTADRPQEHSPTLDVSEAIQSGLDELRYRRSAATVRTYRNGLVHFAQHLREQFDAPLPQEAPPLSPLGVDTRKLRIFHFNEFLPYLGDLDIERRSLRVYISAVKFFLTWLIRKELITVSFEEIYTFEENTRDWTRKLTYEPKTPREGAAEKLLEALPLLRDPAPIHERDRALILFLYCTGCRNAEATTLKIRDIDLDKGIARVTGKGEKTRPVFLNQNALQALSLYWSARKNLSPNAYVFMAHDKGKRGRDTKGITTMTVRRIVEKVSTLAGLERLEFTPHSFRHAFATRMLRETGNLALVQDLLGHADPKTTRVYATISEADLKEAHRRVYGG